MKNFPPLPDKADKKDYDERGYALKKNNRELEAQIRAKGGTPPKMPALLNLDDPIELVDALDVHRISLEAVHGAKLSPALAPAGLKPHARAESTAPTAAAPYAAAPYAAAPYAAAPYAAAPYAAAPVAVTGMTLTQMCAAANKAPAQSERIQGETLTAYCARLNREASK